MKEDILEQIVDEYLQHRGYFTVHNVRFRPGSDHPEYVTNQDSVHSDVDVVGYNPLEKGAARVWVVTCKSWQPGFDATLQMRRLVEESAAARGGRDAWRYFREVWNPKWAGAFRSKIREITGETKFQYSIAVTSVRGDTEAWIKSKRIRKNLGGNPFTFLTLAEMWAGVLESITTTPASSEIGRLAQLLKAAHLVHPVPPPAKPVARAKRRDPRQPS